MRGRAEIPAASRPHARDDAWRARSGGCRLARRLAVVGDLRRSPPAGARRGGAPRQPRSAGRGGARRASAQPDRHRACRHVSAGELSGPGGPRAHLRARQPGERDLQLLPRHLQPRLGDRRLGPDPAGDRVRARRLPRRRGGAARRAAHPGERRGASLLRAARARPRARDHAQHDAHVSGHRQPLPATLCGRDRHAARSVARDGGAHPGAGGHPGARAPDRRQGEPALHPPRTAAQRHRARHAARRRVNRPRDARRSAVPAPRAPPRHPAGGAGAGGGERRCRRRRGEFLPAPRPLSLYGGQSSELENVVKSAGNVWAIGGSLAGPLFQGGRLLASYRASSAAWEEAVERYEQATLQAFAEVSNALVARQKLKGEHAERAETVKALQTSVALSLQRYNDGIASYFEVLEAEQQLFPAELDLARTQRDELVAVVTLYRALGGGWRLAVPDWSAAPDRSAAGEMPRTPAGD